MKKGYYIVFSTQDSGGVNKKITAQLKEFNKVSNTTLVQQPELNRNLGDRLIGLLPWISNKYNYKELLSKIDNPNFVFIRHSTSDRGYIKFLRNLKERYPKCIIVVELPTYPYDKEFTTPKGIMFLLKDIIYRKQLYRYVDRIATYSLDDMIYDIPTVRIMNGIDIDSVKPVHTDKTDDKIHLIGVALMQNSHGYDRIIKGMHEYKIKGGNRILVHLIGDGPKKKAYVSLASKLDVLDMVQFEHSMSGDPLEKMYETADISLIHFGAYRQNVYLTSALKSRESMAKGLPMMTGCKIDICEQNPFEYILEYPNDNSEVDMFKVESFYDEKIAPKGKLQVAAEIRNYAKDNVDMAIAFKPIIDYIDEE